MSALTTTLDVGAYPQAETRSPEARIRAFVDPGTCELLTPPDRSGMLAATGLVQGQRVVVFASDPAVQGGAMSSAGCQAVVTAYEKALAAQCPVIGLWHSGGARLGEGVVSLHGVGQVFAVMTRASGQIPQISVVLGAAAGGAAYGPALTDVVILAPRGRIFVTGPDVVRSATGEEVDAASLGGAEAHGKRSGVAHLVADSEEDAYYQARRLALLLSNQGSVDVAAVEQRDLGSVLPRSTSCAYDVRPLVTALLDEKGVELQPGWARNVVTTLGRIGGRTVGVIATNPLRQGGCLDSLSAEKAARFVRMCDAFGVPLVVVVDVPGYLPGTAQEWGGVVRRGAKLLHAFSEAVVPRVTLVTRKAYGGAYIAMNSRALGATTVFAWPSAEVAVMNPVSAVRILHRRALAEVPEEARRAVEQRLAVEHRDTVGGLDTAVAAGVVDEVIEPAVTRGRIASTLAGSDVRRGRHGNIPL
jgi:acetyl-CoA/propionyl-CoA carboxylase carboxyl transferase subunit